MEAYRKPTKFRKNITSHSANKVHKLIRKAKWYSFDVFDTLIKRDTTTHTELLELAAINAGFDPQRFSVSRIIADQKVSQKADYNIDDIYAEMFEYSETEKEQLKRAEIDAEINLSTVSLFGKEIYETALETGRPIVLVSDMYLPSEAILRILKNAQIENFNALYVSSEAGASKKDGLIFPQIAHDLGMDLSTNLHFGDSIRRDFLMPRLHGAKSVLIRQNLKVNTLKTKKTSFVDNSSTKLGVLESSNQLSIQAFLDNRHVDNSFYWSFGYEALGPLIFGFTRWLYSRIAVKGKCDDIYFVARDGHFLLKAFTQSFPGTCDDKNYVYVSRKSLRIPSKSDSQGLEEISSEIFFAYKKITAALFVEECGFSINQSKEILSKLNISGDYKFFRESYKFNPKYLEIKSVIEPQLKNIARNKFDLVSDYFKEIKLDSNSTIVDSGWSGSIQSHISEIVQLKNKQPNEIKGYYLGLSRGVTSRSNLFMASGYLSDAIEGTSNWIYIDLVLGFIETWLYASHGTTLGYTRKSNGQIIPTLAPDENLASSKQLIEIQTAALAFISDFQRSPLSSGQLSLREAFGRLEKIALNPTLLQTNMLGNLQNNSQRLAPKVTAYKIKEIYTLFIESRWKIGYLKRLLRLPLPYSQINKLALNLRLGGTNRTI